MRALGSGGAGVQAPLPLLEAAANRLLAPRVAGDRLVEERHHSPRLGLGERLAIPGLLGAWAVFSLWSTSRAIRWADRNGWDALP